jgi:hypothetical protein
MNNKIVKAAVIDGVSLHYRANGSVQRVFDTNGNGDLIPVAFMPAGNYFSLYFQPFGQIYAEVY